MKAAALLASAALLTAAAVEVDAKSSTNTEFRGYENCVSAAEGETRGLVTSREYLIHRTPDMNQYFINASAWNEGERVRVRVACDTSRNGRRLLDLSVADGSYVLDQGQVNVRVAQN